jgi:DNA repair exonuclease SbcCD ATPase subunit
MDIIEWFPCSCVEELEDKEAWYIVNNECVNEHVPGAYRRAGGTKAYKKQYQSDNAEDIKAYKKQYYTKNSDKINARRSVKHNCDVCGGKYTLSNKSQHYKTKTHQKAIAEAVKTHAPSPQPQTINNINCQVCNLTQQK